MLPEKTRQDAVSFKDLIFLFYGGPGIGKSTLASAFTNGEASPLFLYTSPIRYISAYKLAISSWSAFKKAVRELEREKPDRYSAIVVDVVDTVWTYCRKEVCEKAGIEHEGDLTHGKGWDLVRSEFIGTAAKLCALGYPVIWLSHAKSVETRGRIITTKRIEPTAQTACRGIILPVCDIEGYIGFNADSADDLTGEGQRRIFFEPSETIEAKDWTGLLPSSIPMCVDDDGKADPKRTVAIIKAYLTGKKAKEPKAKMPSSPKGKKVRKGRTD